MTFNRDLFLQSQSQMPLLETLQRLSYQPDAAFYAPGHKRGEGISQALVALLGKSVFKADLPELPALDNLFAPEGVIKQAQALAAEAFGAEKTWFLINGSTCGVIAAILATCTPGDKIILPRNVHQSAIAGLILSGAIPVFINPEYNCTLDLPYNLTPEAIERALKQHPDVKAVMLVSPTYHGICGNIAAIAQIVHSYDIPLLVDEAHSAHFHFHLDLPPSALSAGADLTVQSTHKVLGAMTQASMLHLQGSRINPQRINQALQLVESTSPSYLLLASLDAARQQMALQGTQLLTKTLQLAEEARRAISQIPSLSVLDFQIPLPGFQYLDKTRLTVDISGLGLNGFQVDEIFQERFAVTAELPMLQHLAFIISIGNTEADIQKLIQAFTKLSIEVRSQKSEVRSDYLLPLPTFPTLPTPPTFPTLSCSPREAFFSITETVKIEQTIGRISAELICPYPPGIPVLMPGEIITTEGIDYLEKIINFGGNITGCSDSSFKTLKVIQE